MKLDDLPEPEYVGPVDIDELKTDGQNPNSMKPDMFEFLKDRIRERGWVGNHILTNTDGVIADGEHRWRAARDMGLEEVPVKKLDITDSERRLIRQEMNKIHGFHDKEIDAKEFEKIVNSDESNSAKDLIDARDEELEEVLNPPDDEFKPEEFESPFNIACPNCGHVFDND